MTRLPPLPSCTRCGEPIGVYEPAITVAGDRVFDSSWEDRARTDLASASHYHRDCYTPTDAQQRD
jgi:hypothetical protein